MIVHLKRHAKAANWLLGKVLICFGYFLRAELPAVCAAQMENS